MIHVTYLVGWPTVCIVRVKNTNPECWWFLALLPVHIKTKPGYNSRWFVRIMLVTSSQNQTGAMYYRFKTDHVLTTKHWKSRRVVLNTGLSENIHKSLIKICVKTANPKEICKAFHGLPGPKSRLFMGCQATELNHFSKPFKMDLNLYPITVLTLTSSRSIRLTCQTFDGSYQVYLDGVAYLKRQDNPGF